MKWILFISTLASCVTTTAKMGQPIIRRSEMVLHCDPLDANVTLDGVPQGTCDDYDGDPRGLLLSKGTHQISVEKPGFAAWSTVVEADTTRVVMNVKLNSL